MPIFAFLGQAPREHRTESAVIEKMLAPVARCLTPAVAQQSAERRADPPTPARIDALAAPCSAGARTEAAHREYAASVEAIELSGILQAQARTLLAHLSPS